MKAFGLLAKFKGLRGTPLDPFGKTEERKTERALISEYADTMTDIAGKLTPENLALAVEIASVPEHIRGFGHVKERHLKTAKAERESLLDRFEKGDVETLAAE
jgi:indolepyruvate ferredoxin oxidoreductase